MSLVDAASKARVPRARTAPASRLPWMFTVAAVLTGGIAGAQTPPAGPPGGPPQPPPTTGVPDPRFPGLRPPPPVLDIKPLGGDRFQLGRIIIDKQAHRFTVPGRVAHLDDAPLEYLAVSTRGYKAYESLLEIDASGSAFNLACILIGLDASESVRPSFQFDRQQLEGPLVAVEITWLDSHQQTRRINADEALVPRAERPKGSTGQWVYFGSLSFAPDEVFAADVSGALIGLAHDPSSVIEHRRGLGIGAYGSVRGDPQSLPPAGAPVELVVAATGKSTRVPPARAGAAPPPPPQRSQPK